MILVGTGNIAFEYAKALKALGPHWFTSIGNTDHGCARWAERMDAEKMPCKMIQVGGVSDSAVLSVSDKHHAIVAIPINAQYETVKRLLAIGVKRILVEKPGVLYSIQARGLAYLARAAGADIRVAYNRRFYASVQAAKDIIERGGLSDMWFCFGEDMDAVLASAHPKNIKDKWMLANSSHIIDVAKYLCGGWSIVPHQTPGMYSGTGFTLRDHVPVSYMTDYRKDTRWSIQFVTKAGYRYRLAPVERLEKLINEKWGIVEETPAGGIKAGFLDMTRSFLTGAPGLPTIDEQLALIQDIDKIGGFKE